MASGISSGWGYSVAQVAGLNPRMEKGKHPLTYENNLTSYPPTFTDGRFISPLENLKLDKFNFGYKQVTDVCALFLKNKTINPITGKTLIKNSSEYNLFMNQCKLINTSPEFVLYPKSFISFSGKKFTVGNQANVGGNQLYTITNIGPKQILLRKSINGKEIRLKINKFIELNKM